MAENFIFVAFFTVWFFVGLRCSISFINKFIDRNMSALEEERNKFFFNENTKLESWRKK
jgi:hypothetical protein